MRIKSATLRGVGPFAETAVAFSPALSIISGPNASGKSTIVRSIADALAGRAPARSHLHTSESRIQVEISISSSEASALARSAGISWAPSRDLEIVRTASALGGRWLFETKLSAEDEESGLGKALRRANLGQQLGVQQVAGHDELNPHALAEQLLRVEAAGNENDIDRFYEVFANAPRPHAERDSEGARLVGRLGGRTVRFDYGSAGQRQLMALAITLADPGARVLMLDAVLESFESEMRERVLRQLQASARERQIVLTTTAPPTTETLSLGTTMVLERREAYTFALRQISGAKDLPLSTPEFYGNLSQEDLIALARAARRNTAQELLQRLAELPDPRADLVQQWQREFIGFFPPSDDLVDDSIVPTGQAASIAMKLRACPPGHAHYVQFQDIVYECLQYAMCPPLVSPRAQVPTEDRHQQRDILLHIPRTVKNGYWLWLQTAYQCVAVIVDAKNHKDPITSADVTSFGKYLHPDRLGAYGILATRAGGDNGAWKEVERLWQYEKKMVIILSDQHLIELASRAATEKDVEVVLDRVERKVREMI